MLDILGMDVVLHDVPVFIALFALIFCKINPLQHVMVGCLMIDGIVEGTLAILDTWWHLPLRTLHYFCFVSIAKDPHPLFFCCIDILLANWIEAIAMAMLGCCFQKIQFPVSCYLF